MINSRGSDNNYMDDFELVNGYAIVDNNFKMVTANEEMYIFLGIANNYSVMDMVHQVDLDDFVDVANSLRRNVKKSMCMRIRRKDSSYRWMLVDIEKKCINGNDSQEYLELHISDIQAIRNFNRELQSMLKSFTHVMAMDNELFFTYDYRIDEFTLFSFVDNELFTIMKDKLENICKTLVETKTVSEESVPELLALEQDILAGNVEYSHTIESNFLNERGGKYFPTEVKGSTIYSELEPSQSAGSFKTLSGAFVEFSRKTFDHNMSEYSMQIKDLAEFCKRNILIDDKCQLALVDFKIDNIDAFMENHGEDDVAKIMNIVEDCILKTIEYRGMLCKVEDYHYGIVVKDINPEVSLRAFISYIRTMIAWSCKTIDPSYDITFSIGVARYPTNGKTLAMAERKMIRAAEIAKEKGGNRFIIYKEALHGELPEEENDYEGEGKDIK